ncbi:hypothetical protein AB0323_11870 [Arthrobacter sp. NPDC080031]|uniref:hypothetical protein n=1 Tax=Arthrobacter sp. NPDC080031 TaxID=3155918 RepID=UPI00344E0B39
MADEPGYAKFKLDPLTARMSIVSTSDTQPPIYATAESLSAAVSEFPTSNTVPVEVAGLLSVASKLLVASVLQYEFAAVAMEKALQGVELAVRIRLDSTSARVKLFGLIDKLLDLPGFAQADIDRLHDMRKMRNIFAHPKEAAALPLVMCVGWVRFCSEVIVEIFDQPDSSE